MGKRVIIGTAVAALVAFGHTAAASGSSGGSESSDGRMVDRPGQGNNPLDLIVQSIPKSQDG